MATAAATTPEAQAAYIAKYAEPNLSFTLQTENVDPKLQYDIVFAGFNTLRKFAAVAKDDLDVRAWLRDEMGNPPRIQVALVVSAWELAKLTK